MPVNGNTDALERVAREQLSIAVEVLSNIHYLIEQGRDNPNSVKQYLDLAKPAMQVIRDVARQDVIRPRLAPTGPTPPSPEPTVDDANPLPLAAAGKDADPETRVDRLEAD